MVASSAEVLVFIDNSPKTRVLEVIDSRLRDQKAGTTKWCVTEAMRAVVNNTPSADLDVDRRVGKAIRTLGSGDFLYQFKVGRQSIEQFLKFAIFKYLAETSIERSLKTEARALAGYLTGSTEVLLGQDGFDESELAKARKYLASNRFRRIRSRKLRNLFDSQFKKEIAELVSTKGSIPFGGSAISWAKFLLETDDVENCFRDEYRQTASLEISDNKNSSVFRSKVGLVQDLYQEYRNERKRLAKSKVFKSVLERSGFNELGVGEELMHRGKIDSMIHKLAWFKVMRMSGYKYLKAQLSMVGKKFKSFVFGGLRFGRSLLLGVLVIGVVTSIPAIFFVSNQRSSTNDELRALAEHRHPQLSDEIESLDKLVHDLSDFGAPDAVTDLADRLVEGVNFFNPARYAEAWSVNTVVDESTIIGKEYEMFEFEEIKVYYKFSFQPSTLHQDKTVQHVDVVVALHQDLADPDVIVDLRQQFEKAGQVAASQLMGEGAIKDPAAISALLGTNLDEEEQTLGVPTPKGEFEVSVLGSAPQGLDPIGLGVLIRA